MGSGVVAKSVIESSDVYTRPIRKTLKQIILFLDEHESSVLGPDIVATMPEVVPGTVYSKLRMARDRGWVIAESAYAEAKAKQQGGSLQRYSLTEQGRWVARQLRKDPVTDTRMTILKAEWLYIAEEVWGTESVWEGRTRIARCVSLEGALRAHQDGCEDPFLMATPAPGPYADPAVAEAWVVHHPAEEPTEDWHLWIFKERLAWR